MIDQLRPLALFHESLSYCVAGLKLLNILSHLPVVTTMPDLLVEN